jgi:hypothetical protein
MFFGEEEGYLVSKFVSNFLPQPGVKVSVPAGEHNYEFEEGWIKVEVISVAVDLALHFDGLADADIECKVLRQQR